MESPWVTNLKNAIVKDRQARLGERESDFQKFLSRGRISFPEYLDFGRRNGNRWVFDNAQQRIYRRLFAEPGIVRMNRASFPKRSKAIGLPDDAELYLPAVFLEDFFDMELTLHSILMFAFNAAKGGEAMRQILMMFGPPGTAKSQIDEFMSAKLTGAPLFSIAGCPIQDHPLWLIPRRLREEWSRSLGVSIPVDKEICEACRANLGTKRDPEGNSNAWEEMEVDIRAISARRKLGVAVIPPFDPNTMGSEVIIGEEDISMLKDRNIAAYERWIYGAMGRAGGGLLKCRELLLSPPEAHHLFYMATQEQQFPNPRYDGYASSNFFVIAHTNVPQLLDFRSDPRQEAFFDRIYPVPVRYTLSWEGQLKILNKMFQRGKTPRKLTPEELEALQEGRLDLPRRYYISDPSRLADFDCEPHMAVGAREFLARFVSASAIGPGEESAPLSGEEIHDLLDILSGEKGEEAPRHYYSENPTAGYHGSSPRSAAKVLDDAAAQALFRWDIECAFTKDPSRSAPCVSVEDIRRVLTRRLREEFALAEEAEAKKEQARIDFLKGLVEGGFADAFEGRLKREFLNDLFGAGIAQEAFSIQNGSPLELAIGLNEENYIASVRTIVDREARGDYNQEGIDLDRLDRIEKRLGIIDSTAKREFRPKLLAAWNGRLDRIRQGAGPNDAEETLVLRFKEAAKSDFMKMHDQSLMADSVEWIESNCSSASLFERSVLSRLPKGKYCVVCLTGYLKKLAASPLVAAA